MTGFGFFVPEILANVADIFYFQWAKIKSVPLIVPFLDNIFFATLLSTAYD
ncbi:MAG: hypothetical protein Q8R54_01980 [Methylobacter sp.]|nr:hypothetical protein [Methylobacter sp.]